MRTAAAGRSDVITAAPSPTPAAVAARVVVIADISDPDVSAIAVAGSDSDCARSQTQRREQGRRCNRRAQAAHWAPPLCGMAGAGDTAGFASLSDSVHSINPTGAP